MRIGFVINPNAGRGRGKKIWQQLQPVLEHLDGYEVVFTEGPGDASALAQQLVSRGCNRIVALGGDGTLNEVLNGLVGSGAELALVPAGTGNDYAHTLGLPVDPVAAAELACTGTAQPVDVGCIGDRSHFINIAGVGFDAAVADRASRYPRLFGGAFPYLVAVLTTLATYRPVPVTLTIDGTKYERDVLLVAVGNGRFFGGGMEILPPAAVDDGLLDICIVGPLTKSGTLRAFPMIYKGTHVTHPMVEMLKGKEITIEPRGGEAHAQADGELIGTLPLHISLRAGAVHMVKPKT